MIIHLSIVRKVYIIICIFAYSSNKSNTAQLFNMSKKLYIITTSIICLFLLNCNGDKKHKDVNSEENSTTENTSLHQYQYNIRIDTLDIEEFSIKNGDNLSSIFNKAGFSMNKVDSIITATKDVLDPRKLQVGKQYATLSARDSSATVKYVIFERSNIDFAIVDLTQDSITAYEFNKEVILKTHYAEGQIESNLWNSIAGNGGDPLLSLKLSDIYAWQIDFFDIKKGDSFKVLYDIAYVDDSIPLYIADIRSAIFTHQNNDFVAIPFEQDSVREFFDEAGNSLRKAFLKAPLNFNRISSRFSNARFHPVLKRYRAHHGVDYAAPTGTPVRTIGDGIVTAKAYQKNGAGYYLKIKHNSSYTTSYMHLSKFAKGIEVGKRLQQGDVIAYVGSTGLSTGPHLDFRVYKNGTPIDPLKMESPPSLPIKPEFRDKFDKTVSLAMEELNKKSIELKTK